MPRCRHDPMRADTRKRFNYSDTKLTLHHVGFPEGNGEHLESGWPKMYWEPLKKYLG